MDSQPMSQNAPASEIYPDVADLAQQIVDKVKELVAGVETLDANNWLSLADQIEALNLQLQAVLVPAPETSETSENTNS